jgi:hypothetical protein
MPGAIRMDCGTERAIRTSKCPLACAAGLVCGGCVSWRVRVDCPRLEEPGAKVGASKRGAAHHVISQIRAGDSNPFLAGREAAVAPRRQSPAHHRRSRRCTRLCKALCRRAVAAYLPTKNALDSRAEIGVAKNRLDYAGSNWDLPSRSSRGHNGEHALRAEVPRDLGP